MFMTKSQRNSITNKAERGEGGKEGGREGGREGGMSARTRPLLFTLNTRMRTQCYIPRNWRRARVAVS